MENGSKIVSTNVSSELAASYSHNSLPGGSYIAASVSHNSLSGGSLKERNTPL